MFLQVYKFKKLYFTSSAVRNANYFYSYWNFQNKFKKLIVQKTWNSGRNDNGQKVIRTKSALLKKNIIIKINYKLNYIKLGTILTFHLIPFKNKLLSLVYFSNGAITYYLTNEFTKIFSFTFYNKLSKIKKLKLMNFFFMLFQIKKLSTISCLELFSGIGAQYIRSSGTKGKIIKFEKQTLSALIQLPSGIKKIFSYYSFAFFGRISVINHNKCLNTKSGFWRMFGVNSTVRGVAMNAVDHPHGGRTKAIKYQRTPWGKTTKLK